MWFSLSDYPKFLTFVNDIPYISWTEGFEAAGFKTFRYDWNCEWGNYQRYWLDEHEYIWFVLRFS